MQSHHVCGGAYLEMSYADVAWMRRKCNVIEILNVLMSNEVSISGLSQREK